MAASRRAKPPPPPPPSSSSSSSSPASSLSFSHLLVPLLRPTVGLLALYLLFALVLPSLADMTPPGVDPKMVISLAEEQAIGQRSGCEEACRGMACPVGWSTGRSPADPCKCICKRVDPSKTATPWDEEQKQKRLQHQHQKLWDQRDRGAQQPVDRAQAASASALDGTGAAATATFADGVAAAATAAADAGDVAGAAAAAAAAAAAGAAAVGGAGVDDG